MKSAHSGCETDGYGVAACSHSQMRSVGLNCLLLCNSIFRGLVICSGLFVPSEIGPTFESWRQE
jgi:hypothetical protein